MTTNRKFNGWLVLPLGAFLATRLWLLDFVPLGSDAHLYCQWALNTIDLGETPYKDIAIEYPPLAFRVLTLPRVFARQRVERYQVSMTTFERVLPEYLWAHHRIMAAFDAASFLLILGIARRRRAELVVWAAWAYIVLTVLLAHLIFERMDVGLLFCLALWAYAWIRGAASDRWYSPWTALAYLALGLGAAYKLVPALIAPMLLVAELRSELPSVRARWARVSLASLLFSLALCVPFALEYSRSGAAVLDIFKYHAERGIQLESIYSSALMLLGPLGVPIQVVHEHKAYDLASGASPRLAQLSTWLVLGLVAMMSLWFAFSRKLDRIAAYRWGLWTIAGTLMLSKVLSPQFMIWGLPVLLLLGLEVLGRREFFMLLTSLVLIAALTTAIFPYVYRSLCALTPWACALLVVRNGLLITIVAWLGWRVFKSSSATLAQPTTPSTELLRSVAT